MNSDILKLLVITVGTIIAGPITFAAFKMAFAAGTMSKSTETMSKSIEKLMTMVEGHESRLQRVEIERSMEREMAIKAGRRDTDIAVLAPQLHRDAP